jgi:hypothetical protein
MTTLMQYIFYRNASGIFCIAHALSNCCTWTLIAQQNTLHTALSTHCLSVIIYG